MERGSHLDGRVEKIREILKSGAMTIWVVSHLNIDEGLEFYAVLTNIFEVNFYHHNPNALWLELVIILYCMDIRLVFDGYELL